MDTTYVNTMLVVFLVLAALAIDVGYMYVSEEDLRNATETSALAGAQALKQRIQTQIRTDPKGLARVTGDTVQEEARAAAIDMASGKHKSVALIHIANNNTNRLTTENDVTVGFWNVSTHSYTPGAVPVNAIQVRTRRTAESESVGLGSMGNFLAKMSGIEKFDYAPEAVSAFPPRANTNFAICVDACDRGCSYPDICTIPERRMIRDPYFPKNGASAANRYAYTTLQYKLTDSTRMSDLICLDLPPQEVCGSRISTVLDSDNGGLRDIESMMYNPNVDKTNKEFDTAGNVTAWWVIAPVTECPPAKQEGVVESRTVIRYALVRISRICASGSSGCKQNGTSFKGPSSCGGDNALYIDRISCVSCQTKSMLQFPGLHPVLVK